MRLVVQRYGPRVTTLTSIAISLYPSKYLIIPWHGMSPSPNCIFTSGTIHQENTLRHTSWLAVHWQISNTRIKQTYLGFFVIYSFHLNINYACNTRMLKFINASTHICILLNCFWYVNDIAGLKSVVYCSFEMWNKSRVMHKEMQCRQIY